METIEKQFNQIQNKVVITLSQETIDLLNTNGHVVDSTYFHLPYWFKKTDKENVFEVLLPAINLEQVEEIIDLFDYETNYTKHDIIRLMSHRELFK